MPTRYQDAVKLEILRAEVAAGIAATDRGDFTDVDEAGLGNYLKALTAERSLRVTPQRSPRARDARRRRPGGS
jgi:hypothetical protein